MVILRETYPSIIHYLRVQIARKCHSHEETNKYDDLESLHDSSYRVLELGLKDITSCAGTESHNNAIAYLTIHLVIKINLILALFLEIRRWNVFWRRKEASKHFTC